MKAQRGKASVNTRSLKAAPPAPKPIVPEIVEEAKTETDDERYRRILAEAKASMARSDAVLIECEKTKAITQSAIADAN